MAHRTAPLYDAISDEPRVISVEGRIRASAARPGRVPGDETSLADIRRQFPTARIDRTRWDAAQDYHVEWFFDRIAVINTITTLAGGLGDGKTMMELGLLAREGFPSGARIGRVDLENDLDAVILPRLFDLGVDFQTVQAQYEHLMWSIQSRDMTDVIRRIDDLELDYLSIDATQDALAVWGADPNSNKEVAGWFQNCPQRIMEETGVTILLHDHHGWGNRNHPLGATSKLVNVTTSWNLRVEEPFGLEMVGTARLQLGQKNRTGAAPTDHLFKVGGTPLAFERKSDAELRALLREQEQLVRNYVNQHGPCSGKELESDEARRAMGGIPRDSVRGAVKRLLKQELIERDGQKRYAWKEAFAIEIPTS